MADAFGSTSFVVIRTGWSVLTALRALDATPATHAILVDHDEAGDRRYLVAVDTIFSTLRALPLESDLASSLPLADWTPTPTIAAGEGFLNGP